MLEGSSGSAMFSKLQNNASNSSGQGMKVEQKQEDNFQDSSASSSSSSSANNDAGNNAMAGSGYSQGEKAMPKTPRSAMRKGANMNPTPKSVRFGFVTL